MVLGEVSKSPNIPCQKKSTTLMIKYLKNFMICTPKLEKRGRPKFLWTSGHPVFNKQKFSMQYVILHSSLMLQNMNKIILTFKLAISEGKSIRWRCQSSDWTFLANGTYWRWWCSSKFYKVQHMEGYQRVPFISQVSRASSTWCVWYVHPPVHWSHSIITWIGHGEST